MAIHTMTSKRMGQDSHLAKRVRLEESRERKQRHRATKRFPGVIALRAVNQILGSEGQKTADTEIAMRAAFGPQPTFDQTVGFAQAVERSTNISAQNEGDLFFAYLSKSNRIAKSCLGILVNQEPKYGVSVNENGLTWATSQVLDAMKINSVTNMPGMFTQDVQPSEIYLPIARTTLGSDGKSILDAKVLGQGEFILGIENIDAQREMLPHGLQEQLDWLMPYAVVAAGLYKPDEQF